MSGLQGRGAAGLVEESDPSPRVATAADDWEGRSVTGAEEGIEEGGDGLGNKGEVRGGRMETEGGVGGERGGVGEGEEGEGLRGRASRRLSAFTFAQ